MSKFSENIRALRNKRGISQTYIAGQLGITKQSYSLYELGKREPDFEMLSKIANLFETDVDFLLHGSEFENMVSDTKLKFALFGDTEIDDAVLEDVKKLAKELAKKK